MQNTMVPAGFDIKKAHVTHQWPYDKPLVSCRFDPLGRYVFAGSEDRSIQRLNMADGSKTAFLGHESWVHALGFSKDGETLVSGGYDGQMIWWTVGAEKPVPLRKIEAHKGWIRSLSVSPDGSMIATGGNDRVVRLWNFADGTLIREMKGHSLDVYSVLFHPQGEFLLSGCLEGLLKQWKISDGTEVRSFDAKTLHEYNGGQQVHFGGVRALAISGDLKYLAAGGLYKGSNPLGAVHEPLSLFFEWETTKLLHSQIAEGITGGVIWRLVFLADGTLMGGDGGSTGGFLLFWNKDGAKDIHRFQLPNLIRDMDVHPDGLRVATAHHDRHVRITRLAADPA